MPMESFSLEYWEQQVSEWRVSGLNVRDWCRSHQIDVKQFYSWKKYLENQKPKEIDFAEVTSVAACDLNQAAKSINDSSLILRYNGMELSVSDGFHPGTLLLLLRTLKQL